MTGLEAGARVGPYEIVTAIGAGGMGTVYRATDSRLGRDVAIKILRADTADQASRARFDREARAVASLAHPHICAIHDVGHEGDRDYLVLELIDGESLAARLHRGPMTLFEAVTTGCQIAEALDHAHRQGIVHRDLKPANVMLTPSGVKVLDFGLARIVRGEAAPTANTMTALMQTAPCTVMGTLSYMSPEQIEGRPVDARADVFAFGATLYEMLTAKRAFDAPSGPALMASILRDAAPSVRGVNATLPAAVDRVIYTCLAKQSGDRFSSMHDAGMALRWAGDDATGGGITTAPLPPQSVTRRAAIGAGLALLGGAAGCLIARQTSRDPGAASYVFDIALPPGFRSGPGIALSPNGRWLIASLNPNQTVWLYDLATSNWVRPKNIVTTGGYPCWSPDGLEIAYASGAVGTATAKLWRAAMPDGVPVPICDIVGVGARSSAWLDDGTIVISAGLTALLKVAASGGEPREFIPLAEGESSLRFAVAAGRHLFYVVQRPGQPTVVRQANIDGTNRRDILVPTQERVVADGGYLFYSRQGVVVGQPYDVETASLSGTPRRIPLDALAGAFNVAHLQVSAAAGHVAAVNEHFGTSQLRWIERSGSATTAVGQVAMNQQAPAISPDGTLVAVSRTGPDRPQAQLWVIELETGAERQLLASEFDDGLPIWSPDGSMILFRSLRGTVGNGNLYSVNVTGSQVNTVHEGAISMYPAGWLRDGSTAWVSDSASRSQDRGLWITRAGNSHQLNGVVTAQARVSPDGSRIAYTSAHSGRPEVYLDHFPVSTGAVRVSANGGASPRWRADGGELYFLEGSLLIAAVVAGPGTAVSSRARLFEIRQPATAAWYAPSPDGRRFLVTEERTAASFTIKLTLNWAATSSSERLQD